jgi:hypothetical protein
VYRNADEIFEVAGLHLLCGHRSLDRREFEDCAEDRRHRAVIPMSVIVDDQILEFPTLDCHEDGAVNVVQRRENAAYAGR